MDNEIARQTEPKSQNLFEWAAAAIESWMGMGADKEPKTVSQARDVAGPALPYMEMPGQPPFPIPGQSPMPRPGTVGGKIDVQKATEAVGAVGGHENTIFLFDFPRYPRDR